MQLDFWKYPSLAISGIILDRFVTLNYWQYEANPIVLLLKPFWWILLSVVLCIFIIFSHSIFYKSEFEILSIYTLLFIASMHYIIVIVNILAVGVV